MHLTYSQYSIYTFGKLIVIVNLNTNDNERENRDDCIYCRANLHLCDFVNVKSVRMKIVKI